MENIKKGYRTAAMKKNKKSKPKQDPLVRAERTVVRRNSLEEMRKNIEKGIKKLTPEIIANYKVEIVASNREKEGGTDVEERTEAEVTSLPGEEETEVKVAVQEKEESSADESDGEAAGPIVLGEAGNETYFDGLEWEVDCTADTWKCLRNKKLDRSVKRKIVETIRTLAQGWWRPKLSKLLEGPPKHSDILLYEAKVTKKTRITLEKT